MKLRLLLSYFLSMLMLSSCHQDDQQKGVIDETLFYPAFTFINQELSAIDSTELAIFRYEMTGDKMDTSIMEKTAFKKYVESIFSPEMLSEPSRYAFQRRVFMDETIGRVTISMDALDPASTVRRMDMLMDPETEEIKSIYTEILRQEGDHTVDSKINWTAGQQLSTGLIEYRGQDTLSRRIRINWGMPQ